MSLYRIDYTRLYCLFWRQRMSLYTLQYRLVQHTELKYSTEQWNVVQFSTVHFRAAS